MKTSELSDLITSRRSIRSWQDKPVPEALLRQAIELATYAPNAGNQQNWHFYLILDKKTIDSIADVVQAIADYVTSWPEAVKLSEAAAKIAQRSSFFRSAPTAIAIATKQYQSAMDELLVTRQRTDPRARQFRGWRMAANTKIQSVASAIAYLLLILHQMGLGAVWMTGPMQAKGEIEKILRVPKEMDLVAFIPIGYPAETPPLKERKPVKDVCQIIK
ncbi:nitroreductase family protein [Chloroflexota bacterium]